MKALILSVVATLLVACSGFSKPAVTPWPGDLDSELLYWCMPGEGIDGEWRVFAEYPDHCPEERISRGQWDHLPVTVGAEPSLIPETADAIWFINWKLGFEMFKMVSLEEEELPDIIAGTAGDHPVAAARAQFITWGGRQHGALLVFNGYEKRDHVQMMIHELGHFLGLRHDKDQRWSIMYPRLSNLPRGFEAQDIRLLRELYKDLLREAP